MKAITLTQPWATLVAIGAKRYETRSWSTNYRGPLAIHAAKGGFGEGSPGDELCQEEPARSLLEGRHPLPLGSIVAICDLTSCQRIAEGRFKWSRELPSLILEDDRLAAGAPSLFVPNEEEPFGDYTPNRYAWRLENVRKLAEPISAKGALSLWDWTPPTGWEATAA